MKDEGWNGDLLTTTTQTSGGNSPTSMVRGSISSTPGLTQLFQFSLVRYRIPLSDSDTAHSDPLTASDEEKSTVTSPSSAISPLLEMSTTDTSERQSLRRMPPRLVEIVTTTESFTIVFDDAVSSLPRPSASAHRLYLGCGVVSLILGLYMISASDNTMLELEMIVDTRVLSSDHPQQSAPIIPIRSSSAVSGVPFLLVVVMSKIGGSFTGDTSIANAIREDSEPFTPCSVFPELPRSWTVT